MAERFFARYRPALTTIGGGLLTLSLVVSGAGRGLAQTPVAQAEDADASESEVRRVDTVSSSEFSIEYADQLTAEATAAIADQRYETAIDKLNESRELYNEISLFYQELAEMFFGIDTRQNRSNRDRAIEAAQKRDEATFQLALIHRTQDDPEKAIPLFIEVLRSQQPTRDLGERAYQQLFEMGFVEAPYEFN